MDPRALVSVAGLVLAGSAALAADAPDASLYRACVDKLPKELAEVESAQGGPRASGSGPAGRWSVTTADLNGDGTEEAFLIALPADHAGEVTFLYRKDGAPDGDWGTKKVKLEGGGVVDASVDVTPIGDGRSLADVQGGDAGQALLAWNGRKLDTVWKAGRPGEGERRWFVLEDLDENGVDEVVEYFQRELDVNFADEDDLEVGGAGGTTTRVDAVAVYRLEGDDWKKDRDLLESLRKR